jgi:hypothetical protein
VDIMTARPRLHGARAIEQTRLQCGAGSGLVAEHLLVVAALAATAVGQGGFYRRVDGAVAVLLAAAALTLTVRRGWSAFWPTRLVAAGAAVMAGSTLLTAAADHRSGRVLAVLGLLAAIVVTSAVAGGSDQLARRQLADAVIGIGAFVAVTGWLGVAWRIQPLGHVDGGLWRAATTITYANAAAAVLGPLALWSLARATVSDSRLGRLATVLLIAGLGATLSRAGGLAFAIGLVVLAVLLGPRTLWLPSWRGLAGGTVAAAGLLPGMAATGPARPIWAVIGLAAGLAIAWARPPQWGWLRRWSRGSGGWVARLGTHGRIRVLATVVFVAAAAGLLVGLAEHSDLWSARVSLASPDRTSVAGVALRMWRGHLVTGVGAGQAMFIWTEPGGRMVFDHYAHDEYLQLAAEQGIVGLVALAALAGGVIVTLRRGWRAEQAGGPAVAPDGPVGGPAVAPDGPAANASAAPSSALSASAVLVASASESAPSESAPAGSAAAAQALRAGAIAGLACFAVHSGFDFLWHVPVLPLMAALGVGLAAPGGNRMSYPNHPNEEDSCTRTVG